MDTEALSLHIPYASYIRLMSYVTLCPTEISGFADVTFDKEKNQFTVGEVYLLEQEAGGSDVEMSEEDLDKFTLEMMDKGVTQMPKLWWHSHADFQAFFSPTDHDTMTELAEVGWMLALVLNKNGDTQAKLAITKPATYLIPLTVSIDHIQIEDEEAILAEIKEKVRPMPVTTFPQYNQSYTNQYDKFHNGHNLTKCLNETCEICEEYYSTIIATNKGNQDMLPAWDTVPENETEEEIVEIISSGKKGKKRKN